MIPPGGFLLVIASNLRKKGCQITQYGVCLALLDETFSHELIA
jgi:hypothetical protein